VGLSVNPSIDFTVRRDANVPADLDQNLFRQQVYFQTTPILNWLAVRGYASHETGPFIRKDYSSRDNVGNLDFTVGRPWGRNALVTGYHIRDFLIDKIQREYFTTSSYIGYQRAWGRDKNLKTTILGEYIRSWRIQDQFFAISQAMRPAFQVQWQGTRWGVDGNFAWTRGQGDHLYDNTQSSFLVSYTKPWKSRAYDGVGEVGVQYPLKFSAGFAQQSFINFTGDQRSRIIPVVRLSLF
jgi:hypothetical protein